MIEDAELLRRYAEDGSEESFAELVNRHLGLVYFGALRRTSGDSHLAADVSQSVFVNLARNARSLRRHPVLSAWLFTTTRNTAINARVAEERRRQREQEAFTMQEPPPEQNQPADWDRLRPVLYEALDALPEQDRDAVLLRFFDGHPFAEVGRTLRVTEEAARKRVDRALEKLHGTLSRRGITSTTGAMAAVLTAEAAMTPPAVLSATIATAVTAGASASATGFFAFLAMSKIKIGIVSAVIFAITAGSLVEVRANRELRAELRTLQAAGGGDLVPLQKESQHLNATLQKLGAANPEAGELARLQQRAAVLRARPLGVVDAEMKPASGWRNVGRATPEAAFETLHWAMFSDDVDAVANFVIFDDDTPKNRETFMAHFSATVRNRYRTPERLVAAAFFGAGANNTNAPDDALQVIEVNDHVGGDGGRFGQKRFRVWYSLASGREFEGGTRLQPTPDGWAQAAFSLAKEWEFALTRLNPVTGDHVQAKTPGSTAPAKK